MINVISRLKKCIEGTSFFRRVLVKKTVLREAIELIRTQQNKLAGLHQGGACLRGVLPLGHGLLEASNEKRNKRVLLVGWYGAQNFGDELMLRCMLSRYASSLETEVDVSVLIVPNDRYRFINIPETVRCFFPPKTEEDLVEACEWFDEIVLGGGAHIDDSPIKSLDFIPYLMLRLSQEALDRGKTVRWVSVSSNRSLSNPEYLGAIRKIAARAATFSVRDIFSLDVLQTAGVPNVTLERDIAFDVEPFAEARSKIALITLVDFTDTSLLENIVDDIFSFFANINLETNESWMLCFLPFYLEHGNDRSLYERLLKGRDTVPYFIADEIESVETMLTLFKSFDLVVSMRYHAALLANVFNIPNLVLCPDSHRHYFNKMHALTNSYPNISRLADLSDYSTEMFFGRLNQLMSIRRKVSQESNNSISGVAHV